MAQSRVTPLSFFMFLFFFLSVFNNRCFLRSRFPVEMGFGLGHLPGGVGWRLLAEENETSPDCIIVVVVAVVVFVVVVVFDDFSTDKCMSTDRKLVGKAPNTWDESGVSATSPLPLCLTHEAPKKSSVRQPRSELSRTAASKTRTALKTVLNPSSSRTSRVVITQSVVVNIHAVVPELDHSVIRSQTALTRPS